MMTFQGTVKSGGTFKVTPEKLLVSFTASDEYGNTFSCQMWPDDPQHAQLAQIIESVRRQPVQCVIAGYTVRMRKFKDNTEKPQANFIVTNVVFPNLMQGGQNS